MFGVQVKPRYVDIQNLNQYSSELRNASPVTAESLTPQVKDINARWNKLLSDMNEREVCLFFLSFSFSSFTYLFFHKWALLLRAPSHTESRQ